jgi:hypothetical protein
MTPQEQQHSKQDLLAVVVPSNGVFGRFDLAALRGCHTLNVCLFVNLPLALSPILTIL